MPGIAKQHVESFSPEFMEVKRFCSWDERLEKGATRDDAEELLKLMLPLLPAQLRQHFKPFSLRGLQNYTDKIVVEASVIREVKGI